MFHTRCEQGDSDACISCLDQVNDRHDVIDVEGLIPSDEDGTVRREFCRAANDLTKFSWLDRLAVVMQAGGFYGNYLLNLKDWARSGLCRLRHQDHEAHRGRRKLHCVERNQDYSDEYAGDVVGSK